MLQQTASLLARSFSLLLNIKYFELGLIISNFGILPVKKENMDGSGGTRRLMVNVIEPQFNLHSEDANVSLKICAPFKTENLTFGFLFFHLQFFFY